MKALCSYVILACLVLPATADEINGKLASTPMKWKVYTAPHMALFQRGVEAIKPAQIHSQAYKQWVMVGYEAQPVLLKEAMLCVQLYKKSGDEAEHCFRSVDLKIYAISEAVKQARHEAIFTLNLLAVDVAKKILVESREQREVAEADMMWPEYESDARQILENTAVDKSLKAFRQVVQTLRARSAKEHQQLRKQVRLRLNPGRDTPVAPRIFFLHTKNLPLKGDFLNLNIIVALANRIP